MRFLGWFLVILGVITPLVVVGHLMLAFHEANTGGAPNAARLANSISIGIVYPPLAGIVCLMLGIILLIVDYRTRSEQSAESIDSSV